MTDTCTGDQSQALGFCGNWSPDELVSTRVRDPSGGARREPQRLDS